MRDYPVICSSASQGTITTFAARNAAGKKALLVVDYGGTDRCLALDVKGVAPDAKVSCMLLDHTHDLESLDVTFKDGKLALVKPDFHSAAFLVTFAEGGAVQGP